MFLYNFVVVMYGFVIRMASISNPKAKLWVLGRKDWRKRIQAQIAAISTSKKIWVHCASLGEFEQGRPLIESIKQKYPEYKIVLTFFSPSGFEGSKNYAHADVIAYLPLDTRSNAQDFLNIVKPHIAIFIKYEFWINFLNALKDSNIRTYLVSAVFKDHHPFFKWYGGIFKRSLQAFEVLLVQDEHSKELLQTIGYTNVSTCGDTRFDRVLEIKQKFSPIPELEKFKEKGKLVMGGSTWPGDEDLIIQAYKKWNDPEVKLLFAPHEIDSSSIEQLKQKLNAANLNYCVFTEGLRDDCNILILNTMGMLSRSYFYADTAYVGGGFNDGIHNILEPAVYFIPVAFYGSSFQKFNEAVDLVNLQAVRNVMSAEELLEYWKKVLENSAEKQRISYTLRSYFELNGNVTSKVMSIIDFG
jgi:3-deoxy-D-manno-octulosonic-acid transferase